MLIQFSVRNFSTFKEKATLNLIANYDKVTREADNVINYSQQNLRILKSAVIYGANASGKTKFIEALMFMKHFVINSFNARKGEKILAEPFRLSVESGNEPSEFEVIFSIKNVIYRYGFEVDNEHVVSEWLYQKPKTKEVELFYRNYQEFEIHPKNFQKGVTLYKGGLIPENKGGLIPENALMLSMAAKYMDNTSENIIDWFHLLEVISGSKEYKYLDNSIDKMKDKIEKDLLIKYLNKAGLEIVNLILEEIDTDALNDKPIFNVLVSRNKFAHGIKEGTFSFLLSEDESEGTKKYFYLLGPIIDAIRTGSVLVVDELDSKLHPNLVENIVLLFNSKELNPKNAQLVFNTHDTNLLSSGLFRRDQFWFTEKDKFGAAQLYSLADFKTNKVRKTEAFEDNYIRGKYGAVPFLQSFDNIIPK